MVPVIATHLCTHPRSHSSIIALMLGRLGMSAEKAANRYGTLVRTVFSDVKHTGGDGRFKATKLERAIKEIVKEQTGQENARMMGTPPHHKGCKTWVVYLHFPSCEADSSQLCPRYVGTERELPDPSHFPHLSDPQISSLQLRNMGGRSRNVRRTGFFQTHRDRWRTIHK